MTTENNKTSNPDILKKILRDSLRPIKDQTKKDFELNNYKNEMIRYKHRKIINVNK